MPSGKFQMMIFSRWRLCSLLPNFSWIFYWSDFQLLVRFSTDCSGDSINLYGTLLLVVQHSSHWSLLMLIPIYAGGRVNAIH